MGLHNGVGLLPGDDADLRDHQRLETFLRCHEEAFEAMGGIPHEMLYDRMKTVVLGVDARGEIRWHPEFLDFARHWGFTPRLCQPYRAQTKGKIEAGIRYVRRSFWPGRTFASLEDLNTQARTWTWSVANQRTHGTTHEPVSDRLAREQPQLRPFDPARRYPLRLEVSRRVSRDAFVAYQGSRYSVPWPYAGRDVRVRLLPEHVVEVSASWRVAVVADENAYRFTEGALPPALDV